MNPLAGLLASCSLLVVAGFCVLAWFWILDLRDIRRIRRASQFRLVALFVVTTLLACILGLFKASGNLNSASDLFALSWAIIPVTVFAIGIWLANVTLSNLREVLWPQRIRNLPERCGTIPDQQIEESCGQAPQPRVETEPVDGPL